MPFSGCSEHVSGRPGHREGERCDFETDAAEIARTLDEPTHLVGHSR